MNSKLEVLLHILKAPESEFELLGLGTYAYAYKHKGLVYKLTSDKHDFAVACKLKGKKNPHVVPIIDTRVVEIKRRNPILNETLYLIIAEERPCLHYNAKDDFSKFVLNNLQFCQNHLGYRGVLKQLRNGHSPEIILKEFWTSVLSNTNDIFNDERMKKMVKEYVLMLNALNQLGMIFFDFHNENFSVYEGKFVAIDLGHNTTKNPRFSKRRRTIIKTF